MSLCYSDTFTAIPFDATSENKIQPTTEETTACTQKYSKCKGIQSLFEVLNSILTDNMKTRGPEVGTWHSGLGHPQSVRFKSQLCCFWSGFLLTYTLEDSRWWFKYLSTCQPDTSGWSPGFLVSAWPSLSYYGHLGDEPMNTKTCLLSLTICITAFQIKGKWKFLKRKNNILYKRKPRTQIILRKTILKKFLRTY